MGFIFTAAIKTVWSDLQIDHDVCVSWALHANPRPPHLAPCMLDAHMEKKIDLNPFTPS